jgi:hypothetical protein
LMVARHLRAIVEVRQGRSNERNEGTHEGGQFVSAPVSEGNMTDLIGKKLNLDLISTKVPPGNFILPEECWLSSDNWCVLAGPQQTAVNSPNELSVYSIIAENGESFLFLYEAYLKILRRPVDLEGLISSITHLEIDKLSRHTVITKIIKSQEAMRLGVRIVVAPESVVAEAYRDRLSSPHSLSAKVTG